MAGGHIASSAQQLPPFRATTEVVSVDVVVSGPDGAPVRGLTPGDFVVRHEGAALDIAAVDEIGLPTDTKHDPPLQKDGARVVARSTAVDAGRLILVVLDDAFVRFEGGVALGGLPVRLTIESEPVAGSADGTPGGTVVGAAAAKTPRGVALTIDLAESVVSGLTDVAVQAFVVDGTGAVRAGRRVRGPVAPLPRVEGGWVRLETRLVPPGRYQVRVVAARAGVEPTARKPEDVGSVFAYVNIP